jgi:hypothetical protein
LNKWIKPSIAPGTPRAVRARLVVSTSWECVQETDYNTVDQARDALARWAEDLTAEGLSFVTRSIDAASLEGVVDGERERARLWIEEVRPLRTVTVPKGATFEQFCALLES